MAKQDVPLLKRKNRNQKIKIDLIVAGKFQLHFRFEQGIKNID
jgi:hypothetical protein